MRSRIRQLGGFVSLGRPRNDGAIGSATPLASDRISNDAGRPRIEGWLRRQGGWVGHNGGQRGNFIRRDISADQATLYNIFTACGSPAIKCTVIITVDAGVVLQAGITTGTGWAGGSTIKIINNGTIAGPGGAAGPGGNAVIGGAGPFTNGGDGANGGDAVTLQIDVTIDNTTGFIGGGGGGGGGGAASGDANPPVTNGEGGGGGAGGRGYNNPAGASGGGGTRVGTDGTSGSSSGPGTPGSGVLNLIKTRGSGDGGGGGNWGQAGNPGGTGFGGPTTSPGAAGAAGKAVALNGHAVTWLGGNNITQVVGAVS